MPPLTGGEFEEWGNPKIREQYEYMKTYCPYTATTMYREMDMRFWLEKAETEMRELAT